MATEMTEGLSTNFIMPKVDIVGLRYRITVHADGNMELGCLKHEIDWFKTTERTHEEVSVLSDETLDWYYASKDSIMAFVDYVYSSMQAYTDEQAIQSDADIIEKDANLQTYYNVEQELPRQLAIEALVAKINAANS